MENEGIVEKVESPESWISNIVTPKKNGDVRICLDARHINQAVVREKFPVPTLDSLVDEMPEIKIFSKIDLKKAYTQIELSDNSGTITNFITENAIYHFKRLIYGINSAGDIF